MGNYPISVLHSAVDRCIVKHIVNERMKQRQQRRERNFTNKLLKNGKNETSAVQENLVQMLPSRCEWLQLGQTTRRARRDQQAHILLAWIMKRWCTPNKKAPRWLKRLRRFVGAIRTRLKQWSPSEQLQPARVISIPKKREASPTAPDTYRCLAVYSLEDKIIISIVAEYWRCITDDLMCDSSLAFRMSSKGHPAPTNHTAIHLIENFRAKTPMTGLKNIWISEADICGFYDSISHSEARKAVTRLLARLKGVTVDPLAMKVLESYLQGYSFNFDGRPLALLHAQRFGRKSHPVSVPWPEKELKKLGVDPQRRRIGIPQGGALSCFLANAVLDNADRHIAKAFKNDSANFMYLRYCDDIIILGRSRDRVRRALNIYLVALERMKLPAHPPVSFRRIYGSQRESDPKSGFWSQKSKQPYVWGPKGLPGRVPWCSFVGYQIRYDGTIRIRKKSIEAHKTKMKELLEQIQRELRRNGQIRSKKQIIYRLRQHLRSMRVGTTRLDFGYARSAFCWAEGARLLGQYPHVTTQLRDLDRFTGRLLARFGKTLEVGPSSGRMRFHGGHRLLAYEGRPFSYGKVGEGR